MKKKQVSYSASIIAYCRAYHARHDKPAIFDDFLADQLITDEERAGFEKMIYRSSKVMHYISSRKTVPAMIRFMLPRHIQNLCGTVAPREPGQVATPGAAVDWYMHAHGAPALAISRGRYAEDRLAEEIGNGIRQYVILGAGLDTFAFRRPEMMEVLELFEVDRPGTQTSKRQRISERGWEVSRQQHFVPVDFTRQRLDEALQDAKFNPQALSFFNWLGVTYYLPREVVFNTLRAIAGIAPRGSVVVFDYLDADAFDPGKVSPRGQWFLLSHAAGEKMQTGFEPLSLANDLAPLGFRLKENLDPSSIEEIFFKERKGEYHAQEHVHFACAVVE